MRSSLTIPMAAILACVWIFAGTSWAARDYYRRQTIANGSDANANDLHITFESGLTVESAKIRPKAQPPGHDGEGVLVGSPIGSAVDFAPPNSFGTVGPGGVAYLDHHELGYGDAGNIDPSASYFTLDGNALPGFTLRGVSMGVSRDTFDAPVAATVINESAEAMTYENVQVWKDNSLANWDIDTYFLPTGVSDPPTTFTLNPGQEMVLPISPTADYTYVLVVMESRPVGDPFAEPDLNYLGARSGPADARLTYDCVTGHLAMDTGVNVLDGFVIHSPDGEFTGLADLPLGFTFNTNTPEMMASQLDAVLAGLHDFGPDAVNRGLLWNAAEGRWDYDDWTFTYTVDGVESTFYGDIELTGALPGDADQDGDVDAWDIQQILASSRYLTGSVGSWEHGDFNGDGFVDYSDIEMILDHGQYDQGQQQVLMGMIPEPATLAMLALGGLALLGRRRK